MATEQGVVERLRELEAASERERAEVERLIAEEPSLDDVISPNPIHWWRYMRESMRVMPALLAVVEAAQAVDNLDEAAQYRSRALRHTGNAFHNLHVALFRLHTQASDEGKP